VTLRAWSRSRHRCWGFVATLKGSRYLSVHCSITGSHRVFRYRVGLHGMYTCRQALDYRHSCNIKVSVLQWHGTKGWESLLRCFRIVTIHILDPLHDMDTYTHVRQELQAPTACGCTETRCTRSKCRSHPGHHSNPLRRPTGSAPPQILRKDHACRHVRRVVSVRAIPSSTIPRT